MKTGAAFGDFIRTEKINRRHYGSGQSQRTIREYLLVVFLLVVIGLIAARIFYLQIANGSYYRTLSDSNRIKTTTIHAPRGVIFDRNGIPLVYNTPGFRQMIDGKTKLISRDTAIQLLSKGEKGIEVDVHRQYPYTDTFAHVVGYVGQISTEELKTPEFSGYNGGDLIGKIGIEKQYEHTLVGVDGKTLDEVDSMGQKVRTLGQTDPIPGKDITLTLDAKLQVAAYKALPTDKKAAVVVTNPKGEVLALVSKPSFDPNLFTQDDTYKVASDSAYKSVEQILLDGDNQPLLNRPIGGVYPPGSTYKLLVAAAGLENKVFDTNFEVEDTGVINLGTFSFSNWYYTEYGGKDGMVNVIKAVKRSNDIFFYKVAGMIGVDKISDLSRKFELGKKLGIDIEGEQAGVVPDEEWKQKEIGEPWYLGDTYHYGIGQGYLLTTPLQVNGWTQAIANGGVLYRPHLLKDAGTQVLASNLLHRSTVEDIKEGMIEACQPTGVAWPLFDFKVQNPRLKIDGVNFTEVPQATESAQFNDYRHVTVACKTGTAQHGGLDTPPHAWITLFAPAVNPQIVVTVLVESSGEGSNVAGPVAKKILEEWFSR